MGGIGSAGGGRHVLRLASWCAAALLVLGAHIALALVFVTPDRFKPSAGEPPAAVMVDLAPMPASAQTKAELAAEDSRSQSPADRRPAESSTVAVDTSRSKLEAGGEPVAAPRSTQANAPATAPLPAKQAKRRAAQPARTAAAAQAHRVARKPMPAPVRDLASASDLPARGAPAATFGAGVAAADIPSTWKSRLLAHLNRHKRYPTNAAGAEGTSQLTFTMDRDGRLLGFFIAHSSGSAALDDEALAMIRRAAPLPAVPAEVPGGVLRLTVPVRFSMRG